MIFLPVSYASSNCLSPAEDSYKVLSTTSFGSPKTARMSSFGTYIVTWDETDLYQVFEVKTGKRVSQFGNPAFPSALFSSKVNFIFSDDESVVATRVMNKELCENVPCTSEDNLFQIWDIKTGTLKLTIALKESWFFAKLSYDGKYFIVQNSKNGADIEIFDLNTGGNLSHSASYVGMVGGVYYFNDDKILYGDNLKSSGEFDLSVHDIRSGKDSFIFKPKFISKPVSYSNSIVSSVWPGQDFFIVKNMWFTQEWNTENQFYDYSGKFLDSYETTSAKLKHIFSKNYDFSKINDGNRYGDLVSAEVGLDVLNEFDSPKNQIRLYLISTDVSTGKPNIQRTKIGNYCDISKLKYGGFKPLKNNEKLLHLKNNNDIDWWLELWDLNSQTFTRRLKLPSEKYINAFMSEDEKYVYLLKENFEMITLEL